MQILYQDPDIVAVYKPAGLLVHRSAIDRYETRFALQLVRDMLGRRVYPVHRLDKPTAGILIFALHRDCARELVARFAEGAVRKTYFAVVRGFTAERATIEHPLKEPLDKMTDRQVDPLKPPQAAITCYERLATAELPVAVGRYASARYSLLRITPKTGRKHQIRRHMKHVFHPLIGDTTYGDGRHNLFFRTHLHCRRLLLAATRLDLPHPVSGENVIISARPDDEFRRVIALMGWNCDLNRIG